MRAFALILLVACGASAAEVKTARDATYSAEPSTLYTEVKAEIGGNYQIAATDDAAHVVRTAGRWYTPDGQVDTKGGNNPSRLQDKSINLVLVVALENAAGSGYRVTVTPIVLRKNALSSEPEQLQIGDPTVPGWVRGKVESMEVDLYRRLRKYAAKP